MPSLVRAKEELDRRRSPRLNAKTAATAERTAHHDLKTALRHQIQQVRSALEALERTAPGANPSQRPA